MHLFGCQTIETSIPPSDCPSMPASVSISIWWSNQLCFNLSVYPSICLIIKTYIGLYDCVYPCSCPSILFWLSNHLIIYLSLWPSICPSILLFAWTYSHLSVWPSVHPLLFCYKHYNYNMSIFYSLYRIYPVQHGQTLAYWEYICVIHFSGHVYCFPLCPSLSFSLCPVVESTQWFMYCSIWCCSACFTDSHHHPGSFPSAPTLMRNW